MNSHLPDGRGQEIDNLFVWNCDNALTVDLDDPVADSNTAAFGNSSTKEAANLEENKFDNLIF